MWAVYLAVGMVALALVAVVVALFFVMRNRARAAAEPVVARPARVTRTFTEISRTGDSFTSETVDGYNAWEQKHYFAEFRLDDGSVRRFEVDKDRFAAWHDGAEGLLTFKGAALISFEPDPARDPGGTAGPAEPPRYFFTKETFRAGKVVWLYAYAPGIGIRIDSHEAVPADYDEICAFVDGMGAPTSDTFFVLQDDRGQVLQFHGGTPGCFMEAEMPFPDGRAFAGPAADPVVVKTMVHHFLTGYDVVQAHGLAVR